MIGVYDERMTWGNWGRNKDNPYLFPRVIDNDNYDDDAWNERYGNLWTSMLEDAQKEYDYRENNIGEEFDAGLPRHSVITNNLVISHDKTFSLNPVGIWWDPEDEEYNTTYNDNLSMLRETYDVNDGLLSYEVENTSNAYVMLDIEDKVTLGELYKVSALVYGKTVSNKASVSIKTTPNNTSRPFKRYFEGSGEMKIKEGEWTEVYCYWVPHKDSRYQTKSVMISFPTCSADDVYYIEKVTFEKQMYSDVTMPSPTMEEVTAGEYTYYADELDLSETKQLMLVGETAKVSSHYIEERFIENTEGDDDRWTGDEVELVATKITEGLSYSSSNSDVISVDEDGKMTALKEGYSIITVRDTMGNSKSIGVTSYTQSYYGIKFNGDYGIVHDYDPIYGNEVLKQYDTNEEGAQTGITANEGVKISFQFYDTGVLSDKIESTTGVCFGVTAGQNTGWGGGGCIYFSDQYSKGKYGFGHSNKYIDRTAGWHQTYGILEKSQTAGCLKIKWYVDGQYVLDSKDIPIGEEFNIYYRMHTNSYPCWIKNMYIVGPDITNASSTIKEDIHNPLIVFNDFNSDGFNWTTNSDEVLSGAYEGDRRIKSNEYFDWFEDIENRNFKLMADSTLFELMPDFEPIDFEGIGNTTYICSKLSSPDLRYPINGEETEQVVDIVWNEVSGASEYVLNISTNADMSSTIITKTVQTNMASVALPYTCKYYYTVTAFNLSKQYAHEVLSDIEEFNVVNNIELLNVSVSDVSEERKTVSFEYSADDQLEGKSILAEKTTEGKVVNVIVSDIPELSDGILTVTGEYSTGNVLECFLWRDMKSIVPYVHKADTSYSE